MAPREKISLGPFEAEGPRTTRYVLIIGAAALAVAFYLGKIPISANDLGGNRAREVHFFTRTGQVFLRRVTNERVSKRLVQRERKKEHQSPRYGGVHFFDQE